MKRLLALVIAATLGVAALVLVHDQLVTHSAEERSFVTAFIWGVGGALLTLLLVTINRMWSDKVELEKMVVERTSQLSLSEERLREDVLQRKRTEQALMRSTARAEALVRTASRLSQHLEQEALLRAICEEGARVLEIPVTIIALFDEKRKQFNLAAQYGLPSDFAQSVPPIPLAWFREEAGEVRAPVVVPDLAAERQSTLSVVLVRMGFRTLVFVELYYGERLLGLLLAATRGETRELTAEDLQLMSGLADQAAQAITSTRLFRALRRVLLRTQQQSQEMQRMMDAVPDGLLVLSSDCRLQMNNPAGRQMLATLAPGCAPGAALETLGGKDTIELLTTCRKTGEWVEIRPAEKGQLANEQGDVLFAPVFELTARVIDGDGAEDDEAWIVVLRDVTMERQRRQAAQSQDRLATVGQLAAGIAHDFNNIMAIITLYSQSLERNPDFPKRQEYLATISTQAQHASALISQILDFSRAEAMERGRLDLLPFVKEMVKLLHRTLPESISVTLEAEQGEYVISADPARLRQALMNLALNARDAMPEGGELQIALAMVTLKAAEGSLVHNLPAGRYMCLSVADTGAGMSAEVQKRLFEPFFSTKHAGKGTGMGLSQVYGIVKQHGGEIEVDSNPGQGSRFTLYLPALQPEASEQRAEGSWQPGNGDTATVLLVEDHEPTREAIGDTLELLGYKVLVATNGREALEIFDQQAEAVDLVLSDMVMPEMGGVELYRQLMARDPDLKMMVMTGYPLEHEGRSLLEQGIVDWIRKPFSPDTLGEKIGEMLGRRKIGD